MKERITSNEILSVAELAERWGYKSKQAVYKRISLDKAFPPPFKKINNTFSIWLLEDIEPYEHLRDLTNKLNCRYHRYHTYEEYLELTDEERGYFNGDKWKPRDFESKFIDKIAVLEKELFKIRKQLKA